jgi:hypothetical protein
MPQSSLELEELVEGLPHEGKDENMIRAGTRHKKRQGTGVKIVRKHC